MLDVQGFRIVADYDMRLRRDRSRTAYGFLLEVDAIVVVRFSA